MARSRARQFGKRQLTHPLSPGNAFDRMLSAFERSTVTSPPVVRHHRLAGRPARFRVSGPDLASALLRSLSHLEAAASPIQELDVMLWAEDVTRVSRPVEFLRDHFERSWQFGRGVLATSSDERFVGYQTVRGCAILDRSTGRLVGWVTSHTALTPFERGKPLQPLLFAWYADQDVIPGHCGLVARDGRGILFGGAGGSGKSTTSLLAVRQGFQYLGDDYVGFASPTVNTITAHSFYNSAWFDPEHAKRFDWLGPEAGSQSPDEKSLFMLSGWPAERFARDASVRALVLPVVRGKGPTVLRPARLPEALLRLAPSSVLQLPFVPQHRSLERLGQVVSTVPSFWLDLGEDIREVGPVVETLWEKVAA